MPSETYEVVVIGGGVAGLTAAYYWAKQGKRVVLFEATSFLGGLLATEEIRLKGIPPFRIERFYHHYFAKDKNLRQLAVELGVLESLHFRRVKSNLTSGGFSDKLLLGGLLLLPWWHVVEGVSVGQYYNLWGTQVKKRSYLYSLVTAKFGKFADSISLAWLWARLHARFRLQDVLLGERLGVFEPSAQVLLDALVRRLNDLDVKIRLKQPVHSVKTIIDELQPKRVVITTPVPVAKEMLKGVIRWRWGVPAYVGALNVVFFLSDKGEGELPYWVNLAPTPARPFLVRVNQHVLNRALPVGVVYVGAYLPSQHRWLRQQNNRQNVVKIAKEYLTPAEQSRVVGYRIFATRYAQHVPTVEYYRNIPPRLLGEYKGCVVELFSFGNIKPWDRGVNHSIYNSIV